MKKLLILLTLFTNICFAQMENGNYTYFNSNITFEFNINDAGVSNARIKNNATNKIINLNDGIFREANNIAWYELSSDICNYSFDLPQGYKLTLSKYDCKNGEKNIENLLSELKSLPINSFLFPQKIENDGMPTLEYTTNGDIIVLDSYSDNDPKGLYIRMKIENKEVNLKMQPNLTSKVRRVYSNKEYTVIFYDILFGECSGEMGQKIKGKLLIQTTNKQNIINFEGVDSLYPEKKCRGLGNG